MNASVVPPSSRDSCDFVGTPARAVDGRAIGDAGSGHRVDVSKNAERTSGKRSPNDRDHPLATRQGITTIDIIETELLDGLVETAVEQFLRRAGQPG
ncbi:hypothetical protein ACQPW1_19530 [Nocardia sp. CA-128927]|uniref:hypothetical protein n=1 Tax=Nocardia sp. CA-128927 TaxID=3239975 RepID=UPI003D977CEB